jgi:hypothetical protein
VSAKSADNSSASGDREGSVGAAASEPRASEAKSRTEDVALVCGVTNDGQGVEVIRKRGERIETGTVRPLEPGKPIHGEVVRLRPRPQMPLVCDIDVEYSGAARVAARSDVAERPPTLAANTGPAQVATESYRKNWDAVYGRNRKPLLN